MRQRLRSDFEFRLSYDARLLRLLAIDLDTTLLDQWAVFQEFNDWKNGHYSATFQAPPGSFLQGNGTLLSLRLRGFIGPADSSELPFETVLPNADCAAVETSPGLLRIDSICALGLRLIELTTDAYALDGVRPNPFNPTAEISFSVGLDGPTRLEILDARGTVVAMLIDDDVQPGKYTTTWDATAYPSGLYYCRLSSGAWSRTRPMLPVK